MMFIGSLGRIGLQVFLIDMILFYRLTMAICAIVRVSVGFTIRIIGFIVFITVVIGVCAPSEFYLCGISRLLAQECQQARQH